MSRGGALGPLRSLGTVGGALLASSALGYVLLALVARVLEEDRYAVFLSAWGVVFGLGSVLSVVEQEVSRYAAEARAAGRATPRAATQVLALAGGAALAVCAALALSPPGARVFGGLPVLGLLACVSTAGFAVQFFVRGVLVGRGLLRPYAAVLLVEAGVRLLVAGALALWLAAAPAGGPDRTVAMVAAVVTGSFAWVVAVRRVRGEMASAGPSEPWGALARDVAVLATAAGLTAVLLTGYPSLVVLVVGDSTGLAALFAAVTATRVPLLLLAPVQALAVPAVVRLVLAGRTDRLRMLLVRGGLALLAVAAVGALGGALLGPWVVATAFGSQYRTSGTTVAVLMAATVVVGGVLLESAALLALRRRPAMLGTWAAAAATAVVLLATWPGTAEDRGVAGLGGAALAGAVWATTALLRATRGEPVRGHQPGAAPVPGPGPEPGQR
ncbi:hypothetical protein [Cellulomonas carbonis]|uniref:Polysaccharide biosynthesis protein n=1 Tax=Cellulomonas carbonis T26 TaxID=947969 RepID=A0A0A0BKI2_9CELL|nr:hypothetical protein [Cellulomonas carbonis]KGM09033.1 hypothetical protein N868_04670 [Cellulomonas carbonis T26]GGC11291.1 hypothetical protein GCM10010972_25770 [Cellulomonas carbonis]